MNSALARLDLPARRLQAQARVLARATVGGADRHSAWLRMGLCQSAPARSQLLSGGLFTALLKDDLPNLAAATETDGCDSANEVHSGARRGGATAADTVNTNNSDTRAMP